MALEVNNAANTVQQQHRAVRAALEDRESRVQVATYKVTLTCATCGVGSMELAPPHEWPSNPMAPLHICTNCDAREEIAGWVTYPHVETEEVTAP